MQLDFLGIGTRKAGTTWLAKCLLEHPEICLAKPKELDYYCSGYFQPMIRCNKHRGESWIQARFAHHEDGQLCGEFTTQYLADPKSPTIIHENFPKAKLLVVLRNPIDRLYSEYKHAKRYYPVGSFEQFIEDNPKLVESGMYYEHLQRYLSLFPTEQLLIQLHEDLLSHPAEELQKAYEFLGVSPDFTPPSLHTTENEVREPKFGIFHTVLSRIAFGIHKCTPLRKALEWFGILQFLHACYDKFALKSSTKTHMSAQTRSQLLSIYAKNNAALESLVERDLSHWK